MAAFLRARMPTMIRPILVSLWAAALLAASLPASAQVVINEIEYDQASTDTAEFIELKNTGNAAVELDPYTLELVNGSGGGAVVYSTIDLPAFSLAAGDYYVICAQAANTANCDLDVTPNTDLVQNGAPDGIGLRLSGVLVDAVSYEGNTGAPYTESNGTGLIDTGGNAFQGIARFPDGVDSNVNNVDLSARCNSPGLPNPAGSASCPDPASFPTVSIDDNFVFEGDSGQQTLSFTVSLSAPAPTGGVSIPYSTLDGSATVADNDYVAASGTLSIAAGADSGTIDVSVNGDTTMEPDEDFSVVLGIATNALVGVGSATGFIISDDLPTLSFSSPSVVEGNPPGSTTLTFTATLSAPAIGDCEFSVEQFGTPPGTPATAGVDFIFPTPDPDLTIPDGATQTTFDVTIVRDTDIEGDEQFVVSAYGEPQNCNIFDAEGVGTIIDDDAAVPDISINSISLFEGSGGGTTVAQLTVSLSIPAPAGGVTVNYATADGTATVANGDYTAASGTLSFVPGDSVEQFTVNIAADNFFESNETFVANLSGAVGGNITTAQGTVTVNNDDGQSSIAVSPASVLEGTGAGSTTLDFVVEISNPPAPETPITVDYTTSALTATAGSDYTTSSGTLTFTNGGALTQTVSVPVTRDNIDESDETLQLQLSNPSANAVVYVGQAAGTIQDDDTAVVSLNSVSQAEGNAGNTPMVFTATLSNPADTPRSFGPFTQDGSAGAPGDYAAIALGSATVTFAPGDTSETISVQIVGDTTVEPDESFTLNLAVPASIERGLPVPVATGTGTILNDDVAIDVSIDNVSVTEGTGAGSTNAVFTVSLSAQPPVGSPVTVGYATAGGSASSGTDFTAASGTLTFSNGGALTQTISVPVTRDNIDENDESFVVNLGPVSGATLYIGIGNGTIVDDDNPPTVSINSVFVTEGNAGTTAATFTVSLSNPSSFPLNYTASTADLSATAPGDYQPIVDLPVAFAPLQTTQTVTVNVVGDNIVEGNETFGLNLSDVVPPSPGSSPRGVVANAFGNIDNDDTAVLSLNSVSTAEGNSGTTPLQFTATLSAPVQGPVTVSYATADGTATVADADYQAASGTLNFASLATTQTLSINVIGDVEVEPTQTFAVNLSALGLPAGVSFGSNATGTILNDDATSFSISGATVVEGTGGSNSLTFTVSLTAPAKDPVSVQYATAAGSATTPSDYAATSGTLSFAGGQTSRTIAVPIVTDNLVEPDESFTMQLSNPSGGTIATGSAIGTISNDDFATLSISDVTQNEGNGNGTTAFVFTITSSNPSSQPITVNWQTADGSAGTPNDYFANGGTATIPAGATSVTVTVLVVADNVLEPDESFTVNLSGAQGASIGDATGVGTILGDDALIPVPALDPRMLALLAMLFAMAGLAALRRR